MADVPPPPPLAGARGSDGKVVTAGVLEIVLGVLILVFSLYVMQAASDLDIGGLGSSLLILSFAQGALDLTAGILILRRRSAGRILGMVMSAIGLAFALMQLTSGGAVVYVVVGVALRVTVIALLAQTRNAFS